MALTKLEIRLEAETTRLQKDLARANKKINRFAGRASKAAKSVKNAFKKLGFAAGIAAGGLALLVKNSLAAGDELAKTADKLGTTTKRLAGLQHAADITGVAQKTLTKALTKQQKALFDADRGLLTYSQHFETLGLSTKELMKLDPTEQFETIAEAMNKLTNQTKKTAIAYDLFGGRGTALLNTLALGKDGLKAMREEAEVLGVALSRVDAAKMEEANDTFVRMKAVVKGVGNSLTIAIAPILDALGKQFINAAKESGGMVRFVETGMRQIVKFVGFVADAFNGLNVVWAGLQVVFAGMATFILQGLNVIFTPLKSILNAYAELTGETSTLVEGFESVITSSQDNLIQKTAEFNAALAKPPPSEGITEFVDKAIAEGNRLAEATAAQVVTNQGGVGDGGDNAGQSKLEETLAKKMEMIENSLLTQREIEMESFESRQFMIEDAFNNEVISWEKRSELIEKVEAKHKKKMAALDKKTGKSKISMAKTITGGIAQLMNSSSKKEFEIGKKAAKANALIKGFEAVVSSYAAGAKIGGPYVGAAFAAVAAVAVKGQIDSISSQQFSGGGSVSSSATGGTVSDLTDIPTYQDNQESAIPSNVNITIEGGVADRDTAEAIADSLREYISDGGRALA